ncbi:N-acetyl-gamma-glutamyl-phosphate reductase [Sulfurimonas denitrificans DSM 1251]|uniref:N-acetyl-gamma-glutamyl-phosphate reductase n=1 Tax=Sulfurimonas denitrificans (strain ATCC 33889 / DSM 1251) TaxID=326298 RepID=ARGC_SULDN|nr:N-acetyl-gamma-glutamyl-phosphate reductase [Sulfurimonas denitrificans]Q30QC1.1 RecName: Full=N-acetyl-gamma-glutamyl-phosphate reductase; Short=AGPR; AltName: Full=N-acetyl-glutamate semialdehyde dehydrogenase; Short=NAGSA dehydrogenase [Sulfurimonas denitrificans DSM 1251]ABB44810.1 N-acetyl-gamma-glutamyl-phosphate reductase [Sulfurimonas denitrificans DSM 1251]MDD3443364.1 N-acetyl-gamma-glutamyl-phosphate reductase [Sulfurimonas denitrificans]
MSAIDVGVIGASGYTGLELIKILLKHPKFNLSYVANTEGGATLSELHPSLKGAFECNVVKVDIDELAKKCELVFLAVPHQAAMAYVKPLIEKGLKVVDLSADYRLSKDIYEEFYCPHTDVENLLHAVYGLPELFAQKIKKAKLVANPGCFPTSAILGLLPFMDKRVAHTPIIVDSKTGVSGAGKKLSDVTHFVNVNENLFAYNPLLHRHAPEIAQKLGVDFDEVHFVPHLVPVTRGMLSSIYIQVEGDFDAFSILSEFYKDAKHVRVSKNPVDMKSVAGTNFCDIYVKQKNNILFISSAIDNLMRGASSAAVVNANLMMGFDEELGIPNIAYVP